MLLDGHGSGHAVDLESQPVHLVQHLRQTDPVEPGGCRAWPARLGALSRADPALARDQRLDAGPSRGGVQRGTARGEAGLAGRKGDIVASPGHGYGRSLSIPMRDIPPAGFICHDDGYKRQMGHLEEDYPHAS